MPIDDIRELINTGDGFLDELLRQKQDLGLRRNNLTVQIGNKTSQKILNEIMALTSEIDRQINEYQANLAQEKQAKRQHEIELLKLKEQRLAAEAARDAAVIAKAQESEQFAAILRSLKDDEG